MVFFLLPVLMLLGCIVLALGILVVVTACFWIIPRARPHARAALFGALGGALAWAAAFALALGLITMVAPRFNAATGGNPPQAIGAAAGLWGFVALFAAPFGALILGWIAGFMGTKWFARRQQLRDH